MMRESSETPIRADCCTSATSVCCFVSLLEASTSPYSPSSAMTPTRIANSASIRVMPRCARNRAGCGKKDAGVLSDFRPQAFASRMAAERVKTRTGLPGPLESLGCRSQRDRRSRKSCGAVCGVAAPPRCAPASPSSRLLASDPAALATPPHTFFPRAAGAHATALFRGGGLLLVGLLLRRRRLFRRFLRLHVFGDERKTLLAQGPAARLELARRPGGGPSRQPELALRVRELGPRGLRDPVEVAGHALGPRDVVQGKEACKAISLRDHAGTRQAGDDLR